MGVYLYVLGLCSFVLFFEVVFRGGDLGFFDGSFVSDLGFPWAYDRLVFVVYGLLTLFELDFCGVVCIMLPVCCELLVCGLL